MGRSSTLTKSSMSFLSSPARPCADYFHICDSVYLNNRPGRFTWVSPFYREGTQGTEKTCGHRASATAKLSQVSGPGPSAPLLTFRGRQPWAAPRLPILGVGEHCLLGRTPGTTAWFGFKPEPLGDKQTFVIVPTGGQRWGHTGSGWSLRCPVPFVAQHRGGHCSCLLPEHGFSNFASRLQHPCFHA